MRTKLLILPLFVAGALMTSCKKEKTVALDTPGNKSKTVSASGSREPVTLLTGDALLAYLPQITRSGVTEYDWSDDHNSTNTTNGAERLFEEAAGSSTKYTVLNICDLGNEPDEYTKDAGGSDITIANDATIPGGITYNGYAVYVSQCSEMDDGDDADASLNVVLSNHGDSSIFGYSTGSYVEAFSNSDMPNVAGWQIYDAVGKSGILILNIGGRFVLRFHQDNISDVSELVTLARAVNWSSLATYGFS